MLIKNVPQHEVDVIVQSSGFSLNHYRKVDNSHRKDRRKALKPIVGDPFPISPQSEAIIAGALINKSYQPKLDLLSQRLLNNNSMFSVRSIFSAIIINEPNIEVAKLETLIQAGLVPSIADFVVMIENKTPLETIEMSVNYAVDVKELHKTKNKQLSRVKYLIDLFP